MKDPAGSQGVSSKENSSFFAAGGGEWTRIKSFNINDNPRILIIRFSSLGDVVKCTALPRLIHNRYPGARITFLTSEAHLELIRDNPHLERAIGFQRNTGLAGLLRLAGELRAQGFDLVADVHRSLRSRVLTALLRTPRAQYSKRTWQRLLLLHFRHNTFSRSFGKEEDFLAGLRPHGVEDDGLGSELHLHRLEADLETARRFAAELERVNRWRADGRPVVGMAPVAAWELKRWPMTHWRALLEGLLEATGCAVLVFGGPGDAQAAAALTEGLEERTLSLAGRTSYLESAWFASRTGLMVSNDTGMSHIAEAVGRDVVVFFGPTSREWGYFPVRPGSVVLQRPLPCRPCTRTGQGRCGHPWRKACLEAITPRTALQAVLAKLK